MNSIILLSLKEQLLKASKDIELSGHCRHKTGNLSVINRKEQYIIITPSGISKAKLVLEMCIRDRSKANGRSVLSMAVSHFYAFIKHDKNTT